MISASGTPQEEQEAIRGILDTTKSGAIEEKAHDTF